MCQHHTADDDGIVNTRPAPRKPDVSPDAEPFPWELGVYDAHCHPTDTLASMAKIPGMSARVLTVMSTRRQDQDLVAQADDEYGVKGVQELSSGDGARTARVVPSFGWHPWFSYQLYDDTASAPSHNGTPEGKRAHYDAILQPKPSTKDPAFSDGLPEPRPLSEFVKETRARLETHPFALIGEVGIDKAFRIPQNWTASHEEDRDDTLTPGGREGRLLSPHRVSMAHQAAILQAQLRLAGELGRPVSCHGVQAHGVLYDTIAQTWKGHEKALLSRREKNQIAKNAEDFSSSDESDDDEEGSVAKKMPLNPLQAGAKPFPPRICLHSYSGPVDFIKQYMHPSVPAKVFCSFSTVVNWGQGGGGDKSDEAVRAVPDDRILIESDLNAAGEDMDSFLEEVARKICEIKGWDLRQGVAQLAKNWQDFVFGDE
ncbi:TatD family hydrolase [Microdochium nivale]|nr:TatD family hydrolase [Microdochium nivale]